MNLENLTDELREELREDARGTKLYVERRDGDAVRMIANLQCRINESAWWSADHQQQDLLKKEIAALEQYREVLRERLDGIYKIEEQLSEGESND